MRDIFTREAICLYADRSIPGSSVSRELDRVILERGKPNANICDNGTEFTGKEMDQWEHRTGVQLRFIEPGKPTQNAFIESFNGKFRRECLDQNWFLDLNDVRTTIETWREEYNNERPTKPFGETYTDRVCKTVREFDSQSEPKLGSLELSNRGASVT